MKKYMKFISLTTLAFVVGSSAIIVPVVINSNTNYKIEKEKEIEKQNQIEQFKDISIADLEESLNSINKEDIYKIQNTSFTQTKDNSESNDKKELEEQGLNNIINNKSEILSLAIDVKQGDLLISDILKNEEEFKKNNPKEYETAFKVMELEEQPETNEVLELNTFAIQEMKFSSAPSSILDGVQFNDDNIIMTKAQFEHLQNIHKFSKTLNELIFAEQILSSVTVGLTIIAWGVAAFYWGAWWMFGANIPFAIAATTQAVTLTFFSGFAIADVIELSNNIKNSEGFFGNKEVNNFNLANPANYIEIGNNVISISTLQIPDILKNFWIKKVFQKPGFTVIKTVTTKVQQLLAKKIPPLVSKKMVLIATAWANPIISAIGIISGIINLASIITSVITIIVAAM